MTFSRLRCWLAFSALLLSAGACDLNPQPVIPRATEGSSGASNTDPHGPGSGGSLSLGAGGDDSGMVDAPPKGSGGEASAGAPAGGSGRGGEAGGGQGGEASGGDAGNASGGDAGNASGGDAAG